MTDTADADADADADPTERKMEQNHELADDLEGMDVKAKALMHLLKTSSVRCVFVKYVFDICTNVVLHLGVRGNHGG